MLTAMGFLVKSGVLFPGGIFSTYCVIITPGILELFLISTVNITKEHTFVNLFRKLRTILNNNNKRNLPCHYGIYIIIKKKRKRKVVCNQSATRGQ